MAKKSQINRDNKRKKLIARYAERRAELRKRLNDANVTIEEKIEIQEQFSKLPRNSTGGVIVSVDPTIEMLTSGAGSGTLISKLGSSQ